MKKEIISVLMMIILLAILFSGCTTDNGKNEKGISANDGWDLIREDVMEWDSDASLVLIYSNSDSLSSNDGTSTEWEFNFVNYDKMTALLVRVFSNGKIEQFEGETTGERNIILNWTIDSIKAVEIAESNSEVNKYFQEYPNAGITDITLNGPNKFSSDCSWRIQWHGGSMADHEPMEIKIDGHTGEILETGNY